MSPFEHGETFVLDDGGETDLDLGNYERFVNIILTLQSVEYCTLAEILLFTINIISVSILYSLSLILY